MFVLQATSADLYALRERLERGLACRGPALFSVFAGSPAAAGDLPPYLTAAAAQQSRAVPGVHLRRRRRRQLGDALLAREQSATPTPTGRSRRSNTSDEAAAARERGRRLHLRRFRAVRPRYAAHFAVVPRERWNAAMLPVAEWLALERAHGDRTTCRTCWRSTPTTGCIASSSTRGSCRRRAAACCSGTGCRSMRGIHDSHAERLLARERAAWEAAQQADSGGGGAGGVRRDGGGRGRASGRDRCRRPRRQQRPRAPRSDEAWIETARCPSCNECQPINDRMFAYNENKQAYIKDINAGTFRQLVEAAESCQVAIIHPASRATRTSRAGGADRARQAVPVGRSRCLAPPSRR